MRRTVTRSWACRPIGAVQPEQRRAPRPADRLRRARAQPDGAGASVRFVRFARPGPTGSAAVSESDPDRPLSDSVRVAQADNDCRRRGPQAATRTRSTSGRAREPRGSVEQPGRAGRGPTRTDGGRFRLPQPAPPASGLTQSPVRPGPGRDPARDSPARPGPAQSDPARPGFPGPPFANRIPGRLRQPAGPCIKRYTAARPGPPPPRVGPARPARGRGRAAVVGPQQAGRPAGDCGAGAARRAPQRGEGIYIYIYIYSYIIYYNNTYIIQNYV